MREWLSRHAPVDGEDLERHDKWLCMMWPRLQLLHELLAEDGVIFVSIDHNEEHHLRMLMDEIFLPENFIATIVWKKRSGAPNDRRLGATHEFILVFGKNGLGDSVLNRRMRSEASIGRYRNPDGHPKGPWAPDNLMANVKGGRYVSSLHYPIQNPVTGEEHYPSSNGNWRFNREKMSDLLQNGEIYFGRNGQGRPKLKRFLSDVKEGVPYQTIWDDVPIGTRGTQEIRDVFGSVNEFDTAKPELLIRELLRMSTGPGDVVLDSFAGSGTTAHAVLALNRKDGGDRRFILVECEDYADSITAERVRRVIAGVPDARDEALRDGLGGSFTYCTLGDPVTVEGMLTGETLPPFASLAAWLLHTATGVAAESSALSPLDGDGLFHEDERRRCHLLYEPDLEWLRSGEAVLNEERAKRIGAAARERGREAWVFAAAKYLGQRELDDYGVTFCQLPYELHRRG